MYLRARYLAPSLGTFASRDPWRGSASAPRTWNGYAWVEGNVVNRVDPSGMQSIGFAPYSGSKPDVVYTVNAASGGSSCGNQSSVPVRTKESKLAERVSQGFARTRGTFEPYQSPGKLPSPEQCLMSVLYSYGPCKDFGVFDLVGGGSVTGGFLDDVISDVITVIRFAIGVSEASNASVEQDDSETLEAAAEVAHAEPVTTTRGRCSQEEYLPLWLAKKSFCDSPRRCTLAMSCDELSLRIALSAECYRARRNITEKCFEPVGMVDDRHPEQLELVTETASRCRDVWVRKGCFGPQPLMPWEN